MIVLLGGAALVIIVAGVQGVAWLIGPAFMALIVVIAVAPAQGWLRRKGWPSWATTLVVVLLVYAILIGFALGIILSIAQLGTQLPLYAAKAGGFFFLVFGVMGFIGNLLATRLVKKKHQRKVATAGQIRLHGAD